MKRVKPEATTFLKVTPRSHTASLSLHKLVKANPRTRQGRRNSGWLARKKMR
jgi:hypothetical protein